jgi:predicted nucleic-acid-binding protein
MRAIDTNIVVRFLIADEPSQAAKVRALFESAENSREVLFVSVPVTLEVLWVLRAVYEVPRVAVLEALQQLLDLACLRFEAEDRIRSLIAAAGESSLDLADLFIGLAAKDCGCSPTWTLDRRAARSSLFELLQ